MQKACCMGRLRRINAHMPRPVSAPQPTHGGVARCKFYLSCITRGHCLGVCMLKGN